MPGNETPKRTWRIAFLRRRFSPTGGAERYLLRLASGLAARGHQITLYCEGWSARENPFQDVRKIDSADPVSFARKVMAQPLRDRHDIVFSLERVPGCDLYRAGDGVHADWLAYRRAFHPVMGRIRTLLRSKNRQLCRLEAEVFAPGGVRRGVDVRHRDRRRRVDDDELGIFLPDVPHGIAGDGVAFALAARADEQDDVIIGV